VLLYKLEDIPEVLSDFRHYVLRQYTPRQLLLQMLIISRYGLFSMIFSMNFYDFTFLQIPILGFFIVKLELKLLLSTRIFAIFSFAFIFLYIL